MTNDWLLFDVLHSHPTLVGQGQRLRKFVPLDTFLARGRARNAITAAIAQTLHTGRPVRMSGESRRDAIHTVPITMTDGVIHGVHVWSGGVDAQPLLRSEPGAIVWNLIAGTASSTPQALINGGKNLACEPTEGRSFIADMPAASFNSDESRVLAIVINRQPGERLCSTWDITDHSGHHFRAAFSMRVRLEEDAMGRRVPICRTMNWRVDTAPKPDASTLAHQIVHGLAQTGVYRALIDTTTWRLLKWIDSPCPFIDWRQEDRPRPLVHPDDHSILQSMSAQFANGYAEGSLRLRGHTGRWPEVHVTLHRVQLQPDTYAGLLSLRQASLPAVNKLPDSVGESDQ